MYIRRNTARFENQFPVRKVDKPYAFAAILLGFLNRFLYRLSGGSAFVALFCPVNDSVWEHLKLVFFPLLFVSAAQYLRYRPEIVRFFYYRFLAAMCAMGLTVALYYTYTGMVGRPFFIMDLLIFLLGILSAFAVDAHFYERHVQQPTQTTTLLLWLGVALCYFIFTCFPPDIPLFFSADGGTAVGGGGVWKRTAVRTMYEHFLNSMSHREFRKERI